MNTIILIAVISIPFYLLAQESIEKVIILSDESVTYSVNEKAYIQFDPTKTLTIDDVAFGKAANDFRPMEKEEANLGYRSEAIWLKFKVKNLLDENKSWLFNLNYGGIENVVFYIPTIGSRYIEKRAGYKYLMSYREIPNRFIVFPFFVNKNETKIFFIQIVSRYSIPLKLEITSPTRFFQSEQNSYTILGIFYGSLVIMALYNLFIFLSIKDLSYLYYAVYVFIVGYYSTHIDGTNFHLFSIGSPVFNFNIGLICIHSIVITGSLFIRKFLELEKYSKIYDKIFLSLILIIPVYIFFAVSFQFWDIRITGQLALLYILLTLAASIFCSIKGNINAKFFLIATIAFIIGTSLRAFRLFGMETSVLTEYGMQAGTLVEMIILSFALGNRINTIKQEEEKEKALIRSRIASDLHDEIGSNLSSISLSSQMIKENHRLEEKEKYQLENITFIAKATAESIRDIVWFINPEHDKTEDLAERMKDLTAKLLPNIDYTFNADGIDRLYTKDIQFRRNLFLFYKEILNNIAKHSEAENVEIELKNRKEDLFLKITDNGKGFNEEEIIEGEGIKNLRRRTKELGGILKIVSEPGKGTTIYLSVKK